MRLASLALCIGVVALAGTARAQSLERPGTRALGMGGALRAAATGDLGPTLNPSGMSLNRSYVLEGAYQHTSEVDASFAHASVIDSTSATGLAGGLFYTYLNASPGAGSSVKGHQGGLALSFPFGDVLAIGGTVRYLRIDREVGDVTDGDRGFTFDLGATIRPVPLLSVGVVGYGLNDLKTKTGQAPFAVGGGVAVLPSPALIAEVDAVLTFTTNDPNRGDLWSVMGGAEYTIVNRLAVRGGGGKDALADVGYASGGLSAISELGAVDFGFRRDVSGTVKATYLGVSLRLFVPAP
jgi:hypothetical protein